MNIYFGSGCKMKPINIINFIQHSIQIIEAKNTLGEIDFLVRNQATKQIEHWEVALKYYLGESNLQLMHWYGLNRSDTLLRKLNHFSKKQFQFTQALDFKIEKRLAIMKGHFICQILQTLLYFPHGSILNIDWDSGVIILKQGIIGYSGMNGFVQI